MMWHDLADDATIDAMDDAEFGEFWEALGRVVRIRAAHAATPPAQPRRDPASTVAARIDAAPPRRQPSARPAGFGLAPTTRGA